MRQTVGTVGVLDLETIDLKIEKSTCLIGLNRPESLNAINEQMCHDLTKAMNWATEATDIRVVLIYGVGSCFSTGGDLTVDIPSLAEDTLEKIFKPMLLSIFYCPKVVISRVHGFAIGIGSAIAMSSDLFFMADDSYIAQPHVGIGLIPDGGVSWHLLHQLGGKRAFEMILGGMEYYGKECALIGVANRSVPLDGLEAETDKWVQLLARKPPLAVKYAKEVLLKVSSMNLPDAITYEARLQNITMSSEDCSEALNAFKEKRQPKFVGR